MHEIRVPSLGVNDEFASVTEVLKQSLEEVSVDDHICTIETTKASFEIHAEKNGFIRLTVQLGDEVRFNDLIGFIDESKDQLEKLHFQSNVASEAESKLTSKAERLANDLGVDIKELKKEYTGIIREKHVKLFHKEAVPEIISSGIRFDNIAVLNATDGGIAVVETAIESGQNVICIIDDVKSNSESNYKGIPIIPESNLQDFPDIEAMFVHLQKDKKLKVLDRLEKSGMIFTQVISSQSSVSRTAVIGQGCLVKRGAVIDSGCIINDHSIIDNGVTLAHDSKVGKLVHLAPGVSTGGNVLIEDYSVIGIGVSIASNISIGEGSIIMPGSVVRKNVPSYSIIDGYDQIVGKANKIG